MVLSAGVEHRVTARDVLGDGGFAHHDGVADEQLPGHIRAPFGRSDGRRDAL